MPTVIHVVGNIPLWGLVAAGGTAHTAQMEGRMDSIKYEPILDANVA